MNFEDVRAVGSRAVEHPYLKFGSVEGEREAEPSSRWTPGAGAFGQT